MFLRCTSNFKIVSLRNIFLFIRRNFNFFAFVVLQVISLWFLFTYNRFHRAKFLGVASEWTGRINTQYNKVHGFFRLKDENRRLHKLNDSLLNQLPGNFVRPDSAVRLVKDSIPFDTAGHYRRYLFRDATVVYNTVTSQKNFFQINKGSLQGIKDNMAVISAGGYPVGIIVNVSPHFSEAMSLLHIKNSVSASLKRTGESGTLEWDGKDPRYLIMKTIPKSVDVKVGDTILTSAYSYNFPPGYIAGTVVEATVDNSTGFYVLKIKTAADFFNLHLVHVIENLEYDEQVKLNEETQKKTEGIKKNNK